MYWKRGNHVIKENCGNGRGFTVHRVARVKQYSAGLRFSGTERKDLGGGPCFELYSKCRGAQFENGKARISKKL